MKLSLNKNAAAALLALSLVAPAARAAQPAPPRIRWLMGTFCSVEAPGAPEVAVSAAFDEIDRWDRILSLYKEESELNALNASSGLGPFQASPGLYDAVEAALRLARDTDGAFDPTVLPIERRGPSALPLVGWDKVRLNRAARTIELPQSGMALDFGGIGKGWALDHAAQVLRAQGVSRALINFGGQILTIGAPANGADWTVTVPGHP